MFIRRSLSREMKRKDFRVTIFGSARIKKDDKIFKQVYDLAEEIGKHKFDIVTGGGPGLMMAANSGHEAGDKKNKSDSIGLVIKLPWENKGNKHLDIKKSFDKFSNRLETFMALSSVVVLMPGGIGSCLELFYTWQLVQVQMIKPMPIIVVGKMWEELIKWVKQYPLKNRLISPQDLSYIHIAKTNKQAMEIIMKEHGKYMKRNKRKR